MRTRMRPKRELQARLREVVDLCRANTKAATHRNVTVDCE
jgi:hypothetical protein